jgi:hypothetical protein
MPKDRGYKSSHNSGGKTGAPDNPKGKKMGAPDTPKANSQLAKGGGSGVKIKV